MNGFENEEFLMSTRDGRNMKHCRREKFTNCFGVDFFIPIGSITDGGSTPKLAWSLGLTPFGEEWREYCLHDSAYKGTLEYADGTKCMLTRQQCDELLMDSMVACGIDKVRREIIYDAVRVGGKSAFAEDRAAIK